MELREKKGQSTAEYAVLILLVVAAVTTMNIFIKRGQQGAIKYAVDKHLINAGAGTLDGTLQFEPYYTRSHIKSSTIQNGRTEMKGGGSTSIYKYSNTTIDTGSYEKTLEVGNYANESSWGWNKTLN